MKRWVAALAAVCMINLGCAGLSQKMLEWSGTEIAVGSNAVHPADFPMPPPASGTLQTSMKSDLGFATVVYEIPGGDPDTILAPYEELMKAASMTITKETKDGTHSVSGVGADKKVWSAVVTPAGGKLTLALVTAAQ